MMKISRRIVAVCLLVALMTVVCSAADVGAYLAKDGRLKETITVTSGNCTVAPMIWTIEPSGDWTTSDGLTGTLAPKELAAIARHFTTQDFNSLPKSSGYEPPVQGIGYEYFVIAFGKKEAAFNIENGKSRADYLPSPDDPNAAAWSRFIALELILSDMLNKAEAAAEAAR